MGGQKAPDNSAQLAELAKQKAQADAAAESVAQQNLDSTNAMRRRKRGQSLLTATNGELGTQTQIGQ